MNIPSVKTLLALGIGAILLSACEGSEPGPGAPPAPAAPVSPFSSATADGDVALADPVTDIPRSAPATDPVSGPGTDAGTDADADAAPAPPADPTSPVSPSLTPTITVDNAEALLGTVFDVYAGKNFREPLFGLPVFGQYAFSGVPGDAAGAFGPGFIAPIRFDAGTRRDTGSIVCGNGGTLAYDYDLTLPNLWSYDFRNCQSGAVLLDGKLSGRQGASRGTNDEARGTELTIRRENDTVALDGAVGAFGSELDALAYTFEGDLDYPLDGGVLMLRGATTSLSCGMGLIPGNPNPPSFQSVLHGAFTVSSPATAGATLTVGTGEKLSYYVDSDTKYSTLGADERFVYVRGWMTVAAEDGSQVVLDAANGDERTFDLTVTSGGRSETLTIPAAPLMDRTGCGNR